jgi:hypothetical protein
MIFCKNFGTYHNIAQYNNNIKDKIIIMITIIKISQKRMTGFSRIKGPSERYSNQEK